MNLLKVFEISLKPDEPNARSPADLDVVQRIRLFRCFSEICQESTSPVLEAIRKNKLVT